MAAESLQSKPAERPSLDLRSTFAVARRYMWFTALVLAVAIAATFYLTQRQERVYSTSARVILRTNATVSLFPFSTTAPHTLLRNGETEQLFAESLDFTGPLRELTPAGVRVNVRSAGNDLVFTATGGEPVDVAAAANIWAEEYVVGRHDDFVADTQADIEFIDSSIQALEAERSAIRAEVAELERALEGVEDPDQYSRLLSQKVSVEAILQPKLSPIDRQIGDFSRNLSALELVTRFTGEPDVSARVSQVARVPTNPISPNVTRNMAVGSMLGLFLGVQSPFLWRALSDKVGGGLEASEMTGLAVLGAIPVYKRSNGSFIEVIDRPTSAASESYQAVLTSIEFASRSSPISSLVFTSPSPGDGKTTTALNIAALAAKYKTILLIDGDLRRPSLHTTLGLDNDVGLSDVLAQSVDVFDARKTIQYGETSFDVLLAGPVLSDPTVLLRGDAWLKLLAELFLYDLVVVDAPPVLPVSDALLLGAETDAQILVARSGARTRAELAKATDLLTTNDGHTLGVVTNFEQARGSYDYYGGYEPDDAGSASREG